MTLGRGLSRRWRVDARHGGGLCLADEERGRPSKRNLYRFLSRWGQRTDLSL